MKRDTCENCRFASLAPVSGTGNTVGLRSCKRGAPSVLSAYGYAMWPTVAVSDWCGQHAPRDRRAGPRAFVARLLRAAGVS